MIWMGRLLRRTRSFVARYGGATRFSHIPEQEDSMRGKKWDRSAILLVWIALVFGMTSTWGASFPERPVRFLVGFNPGGGTDQVARIIAPKLSERWAQSVIVENRPGADGDIA